LQCNISSTHHATALGWLTGSTSSIGKWRQGLQWRQARRSVTLHRLFAELDYEQEGRNCERFQALYGSMPRVRTPAIR
jgi:predicted unusual protein kinase regulating ubiquinone biosynthesis (AarF/ABC1/UbiB family)